MSTIELPVDSWHNKWKKPPFWLRFDSKNMIFEINVTKDGRIIIEQLGWIERYDKTRAIRVTKTYEGRIKDYKESLGQWAKPTN